MVQIMWKEIGVGIFFLLLLRNLLDLYIVEKYKRIINSIDTKKKEAVKEEAKRLLEMADFFSVGPWNKGIYAVFNGLCWLLASFAMMDDDEMLLCGFGTYFQGD